MIAVNWLEEFYAAYDEHDLDQMMAQFHDSVVVVVVGNAPVSGKPAVRAWFHAVFEIAVARVEHQLQNVWYPTDDTGVAEFLAVGQRPNGDSLSLPGLAIAHRCAGEIDGLRTYCDPNPPGLPDGIANQPSVATDPTKIEGAT